MQDNLLKKYGIGKEELKRGIDTIAKNLGKICNITIAIAIADLLASGDIKEEADHE